MRWLQVSPAVGGAQPSSARCDRMPGVFERRSAGRVEQQVDARTRWQRNERQLDAGRYQRGRRRGVAAHRRLWSLERPSVDVAGGAAGAGAPMAKGMFAPAKGGSCMPPFLVSHWRGHQWAAAVASWIWVISRMDLGLLQVIVAVMADPPLWLGVRAVRRCARAGRWPNRHPNVTSGRGLRSPRAATGQSKSPARPGSTTRECRW
jgi:hypothetical protein